MMDLNFYDQGTADRRVSEDERPGGGLNLEKLALVQLGTTLAVDREIELVWLFAYLCPKMVKCPVRASCSSVTCKT